MADDAQILIDKFFIYSTFRSKTVTLVFLTLTQLAVFFCHSRHYITLHSRVRKKEAAKKIIAMLCCIFLFTFLSAPVKLLVVLTPPKISRMMSLHLPVCTLLCITQCSQLVDDPSWCAQMRSTSSPSWWWIVWRLRTGSMMSCSLAQASNYSSLDMVYDHH